MTVHKHTATEPERIAEDEIELLRVRLATEGFGHARPRELATLADIAEATGVPLEEVRSHLSRMRAEAAFVEKPRRDLPVVPLVGIVALVAAVSVIWARTHLADPLRQEQPTSWLRTTQPQIPPVTRRVEQANVLPSYGFGDPEFAPPAGFDVAIVGQASAVTDRGFSLHVKRMSYEAERGQLAHSLFLLLNKTTETDAHPTNLRPPFRDIHGNNIFPRPGMAHYSVTSWAGAKSGFVHVPVTDRTTTVKIAEELLADARRQQEAALGPARQTGPGQVVGPPPAFKVSFAGRRLEVREGPRWAFAPVDPVRVMQRMISCLENARELDARAPDGPWLRGGESSAVKPGHYRARIEGPSGTFEIDLPANPGAFRRALRAQLWPLLSQVQKENSLAITTWNDSNPKPILNP